MRYPLIAFLCALVLTGPVDVRANTAAESTAPGLPSPADPDNAEQVAVGKAAYADNCARCHGTALEGAANWQDPDEEGVFPAPPHDDSGHTWHHSDKVLFEYTKLGGAELFRDFPEIKSGMPGFGETLSDAEIWAILAYIKSSWSQEMREAQAMSNRYDPLPERLRPREN